MLVAVTCSCGGVESLVRRVVKQSGCSYWLDMPIYSGKNAIPVFLNSIPPEVAESKEVEMLLASIRNRSSYAIILGYKNGAVRWSDVKNGDLASRLEAEVIADKYA